jgi:hypothetical protein
MMTVAAESLGQDDADVEEKRLTPETVAAIASQVRGRPIATSTVWSYVQKSKEGGRYALAGDPHPLPQYSDPARPYWSAGQEAAIREWWGRRGQRRPRR